MESKNLVMLTFNFLLFTKCCRLLTRASGFSHYADILPAGNYMFKVNNRNTRRRSEIFSKLTIKTPERRHRHQKRRHHVFLLLTLSRWMPAGVNIFRTVLDHSVHHSHRRSSAKKMFFQISQNLQENTCVGASF